jgi:CheY-like chemotaxis protein/DNA-directed RNA polymerase specialized sigma24 family protein
MTNHEIGQELPYLRRYARALTGGQARGDSCVRNTLEAILADPAILRSAQSTKIGLYRLFHQLHQTITIPEISENATPGAIEQAVQSRLEAITPTGRQLLLLTILEKFSLPVAASIMDLSLSDAQSELETALFDIEAQSRASVLIIEDEPIIAMELEILVAGLGHHIVGNATTHSEAIILFNKTQPGLVLADIQLADGSSGIDAVKDILGTTDVPIIFITAFPERVLTGRRPEPTYLISKPFTPKTVEVAIAQALFLKSTAKPVIDSL